MKVTCRAGSNIAFIKYWGVLDPELHIPLNSSISMTLADAHTTTTVDWDTSSVLPADDIIIDGKQFRGERADRITAHLDRIRELAGVSYKAQVISTNNFPMASGIASSASGFAALTVAGVAGLGIQLDSGQLSALARLASGSASRSLFGGFVEWEQGDTHTTSVAHQMYPEDHWALQDIVAIVSTEQKKISSIDGHNIAASSPFTAARTVFVTDWLSSVRRAIAERNIFLLGPVLELDALAMHGVMMTSTPNLLYWQPGTLSVIHAVRAWREKEDLPVFFTIDAGPNVHLICEAEAAPAIQKKLAELPEVRRILVSGPGPGPQFLDEHLF